MATERASAPAALSQREMDITLRNRIANQEKGLKTLLRRLTAIATSRDTETYSLAVAAFNLELDTFVLGIARMESVAKETCVQEVDSYQSLVKSIQEERRETSDAIDALKRELSDVQQDRQNKLEYDGLATEIMKVGTRTDVEAQLLSLREAIETMTNESNKYSEVMSKSQDVYEGIVSQIIDLHATVGFEVGERERRAVEREAAEGDGEVGDASSDGGDDEEKKRSEREEQAGEEGLDGRPSLSRRGSKRGGLNPAAATFRPAETRSSANSRASTPGTSSGGIAATKRARSSQRAGAGLNEDDDEAGKSRKRQTRTARDQTTAMQPVGEDEEEEEEGAA